MVRPDFFVPLIFILAAVFYALLGLYAWRRRPAVAVSPFAWLMLSVSLWAFTYGLEIFLPTVEGKLFILNIEYIGIVGVPIFLYLFALEYTGKSHLMTIRMRIFLWVFPLLTLLLVWTNPLHGLMWQNASLLSIGSLVLLYLEFHEMFWAFNIFALVVTSAASILLIMDFIQRPGTLRAHISLVIVGILSSLVGVFVFLFGFSPIPGMDFSTILFLPGAVGLGWVTLQYRLSEILSLEHLSVLKNMKDGVIVLNDRKRILYINPVSERLLGRTEDEVIGQPLHTVTEELFQRLEPFLSGDEFHFEIQTGAGEEAQIFETAITPIPSARQESIDLLISLHDITLRKEKEEELNRRDSIMASISRAAERFLKESAWAQNIPEVLKDLGMAADVSRIQLIQNTFDEKEGILASMTVEWAAFGLEPQVDNPLFKNIAIETSNLGSWVKELSWEKPVQGLFNEVPANERALLRVMNSLSVAAVPIFVNGRWQASLLFHDCRRERRWTNNEMDAFQTAARIFGAAETQALTETQLIRRQKALTLLQEIVAVSLQAATVNEMAETVADRLAELIGANGCFLTQWDAASQQTIPLAAYGTLKNTYPQMPVPTGEKTFTQSVLELERTLVIEDVENTPYASPLVTQRFPSKSILALPLIASDKKLGAVLVSFEEYHRFDEEEIRVCEQAASLVALALEKFQAVEDAQRRAATAEILRKAGMAVTEKLEMRNTVNHILEQLRTIVPYDSASVQLLEGDSLEIVGGHGWDNESEVLNIRFPLQGDNPNAMVINSGSLLYLPDAAQKYPHFQNPPHDHIRSWLGIPLITKNKVIGLLAVDSFKIDGFNEEQIMITSEFASQVSISLENARRFHESQTQALTDALTGLYNRRGLFKTGEFEFQRARRINRPFSILMFDIDHFKKINDTYGHGTGDQILRHLAQRCSRSSRATDLVCRYGGEEFIILLPETNQEAARMIGERLRHSIMNETFPTDSGILHITISIGVTEASKKDTLNSLIERADSALYKAKNAGRNLVMTIE